MFDSFFASIYHAVKFNYNIPIVRSLTYNEIMGHMPASCWDKYTTQFRRNMW